MDDIVKTINNLLIFTTGGIMDSFHLHGAALPRLFPHRCPVSSYGYIRSKTTWINQMFKTMNFSFILSGEGEYQFDEKVRPVQPGTPFPSLRSLTQATATTHPAP
ncbi:MAG: hypothetical protein RBU25_04270, partial [Lentisphaeria bacterium]|nr:hypothetical protein [Lentisphaeria bacterium]